jgi:hypothetical protein
MNKEEAKIHIRNTCGNGWMTLVDILYDNKPENINITQVFQKWGGLKIDYEGEDDNFDYLAEIVYYISQKMCEICGESGRIAIINGWDTTLCDWHYKNSTAKVKFRNES